MVECIHCRGRWPLLNDSARLKPTAEQVDSVEDDPIISNPVEIRREEEPQGAEHRIIDNSRSPVSVTRQVLIRQEWIKTYKIDFENTLTVGGEGSVGTELLAKLKFKIEDKIKLGYSVTKEERHSFQEEVTVQVPPRTRIRLTILWKRLWQTGEVRIQLPLGKEMRVPYRVAQAPTFDQELVEEA